MRCLLRKPWQGVTLASKVARRAGIVEFWVQGQTATLNREQWSKVSAVSYGPEYAQNAHTYWIMITHRERGEGGGRKSGWLKDYCEIPEEGVWNLKLHKKTGGQIKETYMSQTRKIYIQWGRWGKTSPQMIKPSLFLPQVYWWMLTIFTRLDKKACEGLEGDWQKKRGVILGTYFWAAWESW